MTNRKSAIIEGWLQARMHHPEILAEWTKLNPMDRIRARQHLRKHGVPVPNDAGMATIGPLTIRQLNLFAHKVVLGLYFEHFRVALPDTGRIAAYWRSKEDFARDGLPQALLDMMQRYGTLEQGRWKPAEIFEYRFDINKDDGLFMCLARLRSGLFVTGFALADATKLEQEADNHEIAWIRPSSLLAMLNDPAFSKKL